MRNIIVPRHYERPVPPSVLEYDAYRTRAHTTTCLPATATTVSDSPTRRACLLVTDYLCASIRAHPTIDTAVICRGDMVMACIPIRTAQFVRAQLLRQWHRHAPSLKWSEADVAVHMLAMVMLLPLRLLPSPPLRFHGDSWLPMSFLHHCELPLYRPALLARRSGPLHHLSPFASAFTDVTSAGSTLSAEAHEQFLAKHPLGPTCANNIRVGHPLLSTPPLQSRAAPNYNTPESSGPKWDIAVAKEIASGALVMVDATDPPPCLRFAPYYGVPKSNGNVRAVADMSFEWDTSVNGCCDRTGLPRAQLASIDPMVQRIKYMEDKRPGVPVVLVKFDATDAYRSCALALRDRFMTAHMYNGKAYVNTRLLIGLSPSGDLMTAPLTATQDMLAYEGIFVLVFVDDMLLIAYEDTVDAERQRVLDVWAGLRWTLNIPKFVSEGTPSTTRVFLGVNICTVTSTLSVTPERRATVMTELLRISTLAAPPPDRVMAKLCGRLQWAAAFIPFGRVFIKSLYPTLTAPLTWLDRLIDINWWIQALQLLPQHITYATPPVDAPTLTVATDASGSGYGIVCPAHMTFIAGKWSSAERSQSSTAMWEAMAVLWAVAAYGKHTAGGMLTVLCDNSACVHMFSTQRCHDRTMQRILRCVSLLQLKIGTTLQVVHFPGVLNVLADTASRVGNLHAYPAFRQLHLTASVRRLGMILARKSLALQNLVQHPNPLLQTCSPSTANMSDGIHPRLWHWTPRRLMVVVALATVDSGPFSATQYARATLSLPPPPRT
jgi:hypothetical protein